VEAELQIAEGFVDTIFGGHRIDQIEEYSDGATIRETICQI
jgi:hypothetical protein